MLKRPAWLKLRDYALFIEKWTNEAGLIPCNHPGCTREANTIDHIVCRTNDCFVDNPQEAHALSNLQPMCSIHNSQKGTRADMYWSSNLYFDQPLNLDKLRVSQREFVYFPILEYGEHFARGFSQVNGKLYSFIQVTGAGKTIGQFVLPFAINHACLQYSLPPNKRPRVSRVLILVKETSLRNQLAAELQEEPINYGITQKPPSVRIACGSDDLIAYSKASVDFVVCCAQALWNGERMLPDIRHFLAQFELIIFDEFHFGNEHVRSIVQQAEQSIVAGFTATPLTARGDLLSDIVKVTSYGYYQAAAADNSMKSLGEATDGGRKLYPEFEDIITEVEPNEIKDLHGNYISPDEVSGIQLCSMLNVASATIECIKRLDIRAINQGVSGHRERHHSLAVKGITVSLDYPSHAIIRTPDIASAEYVTKWLNQRFEQDRINYPSEQGYRAICAHGEHADYPRQKLDDCDWFWSLKNNGQLSSQSARFLVVSNLAKEGTNNKFCNVISWAKPPHTDREVVQSNGRGIRSYHELTDDGTLLVPDQSLDRLYVITHRLWGEGATFARRQQALIESLRFLENAERLDENNVDILTIDRWLTSDEKGIVDEGIISINPHELPDTISIDELLQIVSLLASAHKEGKPIRLKEVHELTHANSSSHQEVQAKLVENMTGGDVVTLLKINKRLGTLSVLGPELSGLVVEETVKTRLTGEDAVKYLSQIEGCENLPMMVKNDPQNMQPMCDALASQVRASYFQPAEVVLPHSLSETIDLLAQRIATSLHRQDLFEEMNRLLWEGLNILLDRQDNRPIPNHSRYNQPQVILAIQGSRYQIKLIGHVLRRLHQNHNIDSEAYSIGLDAALTGELIPED